MTSPRRRDAAHLAAPGRGPRAHPRLRHRGGPLRRPARGTGSTSRGWRGRRAARSTPPRPRTSSRRCRTGLDTEVTERGRSFSGGQRQRLVLARALAADPEVLVLVEPTSAVDAHTEARIAARLRDHRAGRTTVVTTVSPLLLDAVDEVAFLVDGRVVATGHPRATCWPRRPRLPLGRRPRRGGAVATSERHESDRDLPVRRRPREVTPLRRDRVAQTPPAAAVVRPRPARAGRPVGPGRAAPARRPGAGRGGGHHHLAASTGHRDLAGRLPARPVGAHPLRPLPIPGDGRAGAGRAA